MPNPVDNIDLYRRMRVVSVLSPGHVEITGASRPEKWDVKEPKGSGGATTTYQGESVAKFTAKFSLWKDADRDCFAEWDAFLPILRKATGAKQPTALDVYHPILDQLGIRSVVVEDIGQLVLDGLGGATVEVKFIEYRPPAPKGGTPKGSESSAGAAGGAGGAAGGEVDPNADLKAKLDQMAREADALDDPPPGAA